MARANPSAQWERFGREDPYYGVYAVDEFRGRSLDRDARERFFASGEAHVEALMDQIRRHVDPEFSPKRVLEYGCGVGRLLVPLARRSEHAVGLDVSQSMLAEARANCDSFDLAGVELRPAGELDRLRPEFDLVHSALVLQHVPMSSGERIFARLSELLRPGGVGAIHLQIGASKRLRAFNAVMKLPLAPRLLNVARGRRWSYPHMQMNVYDLRRLVALLRDHDFSVVHLWLEQRSGGYDACTLIFRRPG
jgi:cyclopropane fatty-acyl-phospholipid synthase-like methyltransferase